MTSQADAPPSGVGYSRCIMPGPAFHLLAQECDLAKASFLGAFTAFSYIDVGKTGSMYSAFFQAAIGLERLMKLVVIIDHNVKNDLANPTNKELKDIGHDLVVLYDRCSALAGDLSLDVSGWFKDESLERQMLIFLSKFAKFSRYYNLDEIGGGSRDTDPIVEWVKLHQLIAEKYIPYKQREKLNAEAVQIADSLSAYGFQRWLTGEYITTVDFIYLSKLMTKANPYCVWTLIRLLKPFRNLLDTLCDQAHHIEDAKGVATPNVPYVTEFFPFFFSTLDSVRGRKNWTRLF